jgi:hypothetical protein
VKPEISCKDATNQKVLDIFLLLITQRTAIWWKVMHDFIPCHANLHRKHIESIANCEGYGAPEETTFHALVECNFTLILWRKLKEMTRIKLPHLCPKTWIDDLLDCHTLKFSISGCE